MRLYEFLAAVNPRAAKKEVRHRAEEAKLLQLHPLMGVELQEYAPRNMRRLIVGDYELRWEATETTLYVLRLWHRREDRPV